MKLKLKKKLKLNRRPPPWTGSRAARLQAPASMVELFDRTGDRWILPWAILPEVDYLFSRHGRDARWPPHLIPRDA